ncbi:protein YIPF1 homolog isoform X2 [Macadamia integrifolia]|uniref:protein YIPF1 homolog isoform X2 n=1 Tax=Macadamia integrifolia TaxID=60698 RepID=UPI001C4FFC21|nr:protein YIPF1 homolog isoform X2 [Macadamia integrifolia]
MPFVLVVPASTSLSVFDLSTWTNLRPVFLPAIYWVQLFYGLVWISTTLVIVLAPLGNCATYLIVTRNDSSTSWSFDVNFLNFAACAVYGYALLVPLAFYFLIQYFGSSASLVCFWCMWGYSFFIFILSFGETYTFISSSVVSGGSS